MNEEFFFASKEIPINGFGKIKIIKTNKEGYLHLDIDLIKTKKYWKDNNIYQRSLSVKSYNHDLEFDGHTDRIRSLIKYINQNHNLPPVEIFLGINNTICFPDGRHRIMLLFQANYKSIGAICPKKDIKKVKEILGYKD